MTKKNERYVVDVDAEGWHQWHGLRAVYRLSDVRIVAAVVGGGAVVEMIENLEIAEGRTQYSYTEDGGNKRLEYGFEFSVPGDPVPAAVEMVEARLVLEGDPPSGHRLEIRGDGWI